MEKLHYDMVLLPLQPTDCMIDYQLWFTICIPVRWLAFLVHTKKKTIARLSFHFAVDRVDGWCSGKSKICQKSSDCAFGLIYKYISIGIKRFRQIPTENYLYSKYRTHKHDLCESISYCIAETHTIYDDVRMIYKYRFEIMCIFNI